MLIGIFSENCSFFELQADTTFFLSNNLFLGPIFFFLFCFIKARLVQNQYLPVNKGSGLPLALLCVLVWVPFYILSSKVSCSCITSSVCLLLKVCHLVQIFQTKLSILLLFIVLLSDILVQEYMRAYDFQHALLACVCFPVSFLTLQSLLMKIVPCHTPVPLPELPFSPHLSTTHIFSGVCSFLPSTEI